jgi:hypothetical protein
MDKLLTAFGAALLTLACVGLAQAGFNLRLDGVRPIVQKVDWDDVEYERESAREEREYARESAQEESEEQGYRPSRQSEPSPRKRQSARASEPSVQAARKSAPAETTAKKETTTSVPKFSERLPESAEPKPADESESKKSDGKRAIATVDGDGCKKYFPSAGMTLSVPCE